MRIIPQKDILPVGVASYKGVTGILVREPRTLNHKLFFLWDTGAAQYTIKSREVVFQLPNGKRENPKHCSNFSFTESQEYYSATYIRERDGKRELVTAISYDMHSWIVRGSIEVQAPDAALVPKSKNIREHALYLGGLFVRQATSADLRKWTVHRKLLLTSRKDFFDRDPITVMGAAEIERGILVIYGNTRHIDGLTLLQAGAALFSKEDPSRIIWRSDTPVWKGLLSNAREALKPAGAVFAEERATLFWISDKGAIVSAIIRTPHSHKLIARGRERQYLKKHLKNPILEPHLHNEWENEAVFNPAAIYDNGRIHLLYRAIGKSGISVLGYASSTDGLNFTKRFDYPVFEPKDEYNIPEGKNIQGPKEYNPMEYTSGGGWTGFEDPRAVKIGKRIYLTYLAFGGWHSMRMALTSMRESDLHNERWNWTRPKYISPAGQVHKNWVLFPEKIHGKFAILHAVTPRVLIHYTKNFDELENGKVIKSHAPYGGRMHYWDNKVRGAGPPPLKTKLGWLLLYHANDVFDPHKYKVGAMILDKHNPEKVLYRTPNPVLEPDMPYENHGKPGVVYASGAVIIGDNLFVYYGGADRVVCVATAPLDEFLEKVRKGSEVELKSAKSLIS